MATAVCQFCDVDKLKNKVFKVSGRKCSEGNISEKLQNLIGHTENEDSICTGCISIITKCFELKHRYLVQKQKVTQDCQETPTKKPRRSICIPLANEPTPLNYNNLPSTQARKRLFDSRPGNDGDKLETVARNENDISLLSENHNSQNIEDKNPDVGTGKAVEGNQGEHFVEMVKDILLLRLEKELTTLCDGTSILFKKNVGILGSSNVNYFDEVVSELHDKVPFLYQILNTAIKGQKSATIATMFGMIMHSRNMHASGVQRIISTLAIKCHADNKFLSRMNKLHITLSAESKRNILKEMSDHNTQKIIQAVSDGLDGKLNGDNLDIYVHTNDIRMNNHNHDYHFFASDWTPFKINQSDIETNAYIRDRCIQQINGEIDVKKFQANKTEIELVKNSMKIMVGRILSKNCKSFQWLDLVLPKHIPHPLSDVMSRKTNSFQLPIMLKNEAKYDDCINIMESYVQQITEWYSKAGRVDALDNLRIPVGGDQLTRVRLDGAKSLRAGAHTVMERFENLSPVIVELFHTLMDYVEKLFKTFMKKESGRDVGTLGHLKTLIRRTSVNGNVKSRYKAHEDFLCLAGKGYILENAVSYFKMTEMNDSPLEHCPPENIEKCHTKKRTEVFDEIIGSFVDQLMGPCSFEEEEKKRALFVSVVDQEDISECVVTPDNNVAIEIETSSNRYKIQLPVNKFERGQKVKIILPGKGDITLKKVDKDDMYNYANSFTHLYLILICMKDAISEGDIIRVNCLLKFMIPFFYSHSCLSKYFVECIDYVLKTEILLPPILSLHVQTSSFVNPHGGLGNNRPADLQKENQVKELKELIKSLGANKTEKSIITISKAAPVINDIVENFDRQCNVSNYCTNHKNRNDDDDLTLILRELRKLKPFQYTPSRKLDKYSNISHNVFEKLKLTKLLFEQQIITVVDRLKRNVPNLANDDFDELFDDFEEN